MAQILKPPETSCQGKWGGRFSLLSGYPNSLGGETHTVISPSHNHSHPHCDSICFFSLRGNDNLDVSISDPSPISGFWQRRSNLLVGINSILYILSSKQIQFLQISGNCSDYFSCLGSDLLAVHKWMILSLWYWWEFLIAVTSQGGNLHS